MHHQPSTNEQRETVNTKATCPGVCTRGTAHLLHWALNSAHKHISKIMSLIFQWSDITSGCSFCQALGPQICWLLKITIFNPLYYITQQPYVPLGPSLYSWGDRKIRGVEQPALSHTAAEASVLSWSFLTPDWDVSTGRAASLWTLPSMFRRICFWGVGRRMC